MRGTAYDSTVDWITFPDPGNPDITIEVNASFLMSNWECIFGKCPGLIGEDDKTFVADIGCCGSGFYVADAADLTNVTGLIDRLTDADWDAEMRDYVIERGTSKGETTERAALHRGWQHVKKKSRTGTFLDPQDAEWVLKSKVREGGCVFANRSSGTVGSTGKVGCSFLHMAQREQAEVLAQRGDIELDVEKVDLSSSDRDARHDIAMPLVCHQVPLRFNYDHDDEGNLIKVSITAWDADQWTDDGSEYTGTWWCVDDPATYVAVTPLHERMRGTIEGVIGDVAYERMAAELQRRAATIAPMPVVANDSAPNGRALIPLAVVGKKMERPLASFTDTWADDLIVKPGKKVTLTHDAPI